MNLGIIYGYCKIFGCIYNERTGRKYLKNERKENASGTFG